VLNKTRPKVKSYLIRLVDGGISEGCENIECRII